MCLQVTDLPDCSAEEQACRDQIKRIRKLRWIGLEHDAKESRRQLPRRPLADVLPGFAPDTD
jgi:hypothetical protein